MSREHRRELVLKLRQQGWTTTQIAEKLGVGVGTVYMDVSTFQNRKVDLPDRIIGKDGKSRPATYKKPSVLVRNAREHERVSAALQSVEPEALGGGMLDAKRAEAARCCRNLAWWYYWSMLMAIVVVRGDGRVVYCGSRSDAVVALQQAQADGDRYASVHGVTAEERAAIERDAGYTIGASNRDCYDALQQHAAPVPRVDN